MIRMDFAPPGHYPPGGAASIVPAAPLPQRSPRPPCKRGRMKRFDGKHFAKKALGRKFQGAENSRVEDARDTI